MLQWTESNSFQLFQVLRQSAVLLGAILLANSPLGSRLIGSFELYLFLGTSLSAFWVNGLIQAFLQVSAGLESARRRSFLAGVYLVLLLFSGILALFIAFRGQALAYMLGIPVSLPLLPLYALFLLLNGPSFVLEHVLLVEKAGLTLRRYGVFQSVAYLVAIGLPAYTGMGLAELFWALVFWSLGKHLLLWLLFFRDGWLLPEKDNLIHWLKVALPLAGYALIGGMHETFDNWLVNYRFAGDPDTFALYRYGSRELPLSQVLSAALSTAMIPLLVQNSKDACILLRQRSARLMHLLFPVTALLLVTSEEWFPLLFSENFAPSIPLFNTLLLVGISRAIFPQSLMVALGLQKTMLWVSLVELLLNVVLSLLFVQIWGLQGIIAATLIAYLFEKLVYMGILYLKFGIKPSAYHNLQLWGVYSLILLCLFAWRIA